MLYLYAEGTLNGRAYQIGFEKEKTNKGVPTFSLKALLETDNHQQEHAWVVGQFFQLNEASLNIRIVDAQLLHQITVEHDDAAIGEKHDDMVYHQPFKVFDLPLIC